MNWEENLINEYTKQKYRGNLKSGQDMAFQANHFKEKQPYCLELVLWAR